MRRNDGDDDTRLNIAPPVVGPRTSFDVLGNPPSVRTNESSSPFLPVYVEREREENSEECRDIVFWKGLRFGRRSFLSLGFPFSFPRQVTYRTMLRLIEVRERGDKGPGECDVFASLSPISSRLTICQVDETPRCHRLPVDAPGKPRSRSREKSIARENELAIARCRQKDRGIIRDLVIRAG